jgi:hypothetical protein
MYRVLNEFESTSRFMQKQDRCEVKVSREEVGASTPKRDRNNHKSPHHEAAERQQLTAPRTDVISAFITLNEQSVNMVLSLASWVMEGAYGTQELSGWSTGG